MAEVTVAFVSLGCAKNLVNTEQMMALCQDAGMTVIADPEEGCDVVVLNTCGFIDSAKMEAIDNILSLAELKQQGKAGKLIVTGCLSQRYQRELIDEMPEVDGVLGTGSYTDIVEAIHEVLAGGKPNFFGDIHNTEEEVQRILSTPGYYAYLKIAEGCDNHCTYCVIPSLRGRFRSRPKEALINEAKELAESGVQELIVIAQDITRYGTDLYGRRALAELLDELCKLSFRWIRLHYLYPDEFDDELIECIAKQPKIVKYLDIPIQHASNKILAAMNRRGTKEEIGNLFRKLRERISEIVLRTSIIVGFPGEGEEEFEELCEFLREHKIPRAGVFPFSPEEGTVAVTLPNPVPEDVAQKRAELLIDVQSIIMDEFNENMLGETLEVLCEGFDNEMECYVGRSYADSPDIDGHVYFTAGEPIQAGTFVDVRITDITDGDLMGEIV